jgi:hypothetical protein
MFKEIKFKPGQRVKIKKGDYWADGSQQGRIVRKLRSDWKGEPTTYRIKLPQKNVSRYWYGIKPVRVKEGQR